MTPVLPTPPAKVATSHPKPDAQKTAALKKAAKAFEVTFVAEMLKSAGVGKSRKVFGGGVGEDAFASFLVNAQAEKLVERGGFGLSEQIFRSLSSKGDPNG